MLEAGGKRSEGWRLRCTETGHTREAGDREPQREKSAWRKTQTQPDAHHTTDNGRTQDCT
eukprot:953064-Rhodomonas_salina.4